MKNDATSLIDRYIYAVKKRLPRRTRDDIASELREILQSQVDDEEACLQRPLTDAEIEQILKRYGNPRKVAASYGSYPYLIGPEIFPSYLAAVRIVLWILAPITLFMLLMSGALAEKNLAEELAETFWTMLSIGLFNLVSLTLVFAWMGRVGSGASTEDWDLDELPESVPGLPQPVQRSDSIGALVTLVLVLAWWLGLNSIAARWFGWEIVPFQWPRVWSEVNAAAVTIIAASIARELMALFRPHWTRAYVGAGVALDLGSLLVLSRLLNAERLVMASGDGPAEALVFIFDKFIFVVVMMMTLALVIGTVSGTVRLFRMGKGNRGIGSAGQPVT